MTQIFRNRQPDGFLHTGNDYGYTGDGMDGRLVHPDVLAAADGVVLYAGDSRALNWPNPWYFNPDFDRTDGVDSSAGNVLVLGHAGGHVTTYSHLESWSVVKGQSVRAGDVIAVTGSTGRSTGKHLHFELLAYPFDFTTATFGRVDPNPYFSLINVLGTTEDAMTPEQFYELKRFIQDDNEARATVTREYVVKELKASEYRMKVWTQGSDNKTGDRVIDALREDIEEAAK